MQQNIKQRGLVVLAAALLVACSSGGNSPTDTSSGSGNDGNPATAAATVSISSSTFQPQTVSVKVGGTVTWTNNDDISHTATGNAFDTGVLAKSQSSTKTFNTTGTFGYHCTIHPGMTGSVVVVQ